MHLSFYVQFDKKNLEGTLLCGALGRFYIVLINIDKKFSIVYEVKGMCNKNHCFIRFLNTFEHCDKASLTVDNAFTFSIVYL